ncbi:MAG: diaminopimelate decarboxylase [Pseudomonadales bacterium]
MDHFQYHNGHLHAEQVALSEVAERFGTPCYVYSRAALEQAYASYATALDDIDHLICYAVKANSNLAVLNVLARLGAGFDVVSIGELERVLAAGGEPGKCVFSGVGKKASELQRALELGIFCFNVESATELQTLQQTAARMDCTAHVSLRVNPDVDAQTHPYISTGLRDNKFGIDINEAPTLYAAAQSAANLEVMGIDCHIGSQLTSVEPFLAALERLLDLYDKLSANGIKVKHIDLGGGLGVRYATETPPTAGDYLGRVIERLGERRVQLLVEPGRSICANAGVLLTQVTSLKDNGAKNFAIVDAAMNDMLRPALYDAWLGVEPLQQSATAPQRDYDIVGPVCESADFIAKNRRLALSTDDLLAVRSAGAYGFVMSSNYNSRPRAAEVMVDGNIMHLVRQRETLQDLLRGESLLPEG